MNTADHSHSRATLTAIIEKKRWNQLVDQCAFLALRSFSGGMSLDDAIEVAHEVRAECYEILIDDSVETAEKVQVLVRSLEKHKQRLKRHAKRHLLPDTGDSSLFGTTESCEQLVVRRDHLRAVLRLLFSLFPTALKCQHDRDHDLLISFYRLDEVGIKPRLCPEAVTFTSESAQKKAVYRARTRFSSTLEELAEFELSAAPEGRKELFADVLKLVRAPHGLQDALYVVLEEFDWEL